MTNLLHNSKDQKCPCIDKSDKSDIVDVLREDIARDTASIRSIKENIELVSELSTKSPTELLDMYNSHLTRSERLLDRIRKIPEC